MAHRPTNRARTTARIAVRGAVASLGATAAVLAATGAVGSAQAASGNTWDRLAQCESSGDWHINTGNGYYGGLQFSDATWDGFGGEQYAARADLASRAQQIRVAERVLDTQGWGAWPACSAELGLDGGDAAGNPDTSPRPSRSGSRTPAPSGGDYTVQSGDTLSKIARAEGVSGGWRAIYSANRDTITNPNLIYVGEVLALP